MNQFVVSLISGFALMTYPLLGAGLATPAPPMELTGTHGKFDFIKVDADQRRLLACHTGNGSLDVINVGDFGAPKLIKSVPTGNAQGVAIDAKGARYFVSCSKPPQLVIVDSTKLDVIGEVPLPAAADLCAYDVKTNHVFVDSDEKPEMWVIDPEAKKILSTITFPGAGMEDLGFSADGAFLFQALKDASLLVKIDTASGKIVGQWPTSPADKPHGLAMIDADNAVLLAGGGGELAMIDLATGKVIASAKIAPRVDEIAYDPADGNVYCASGTGVISIVNPGKTTMNDLGSVASSPGTHSIAVDPKSTAVWIAFAKGDKSFVQAFPSKAK